MARDDVSAPSPGKLGALTGAASGCEADKAGSAPASGPPPTTSSRRVGVMPRSRSSRTADARSGARSEEHTSELQSLRHLVCRLLLEKKKTTKTPTLNTTQ